MASRIAPDHLDNQAAVQERVRRLEINPGPPVIDHPAPWMPVYGPISELDLIAQTMAGFPSFNPDDVGPRHPLACELTERLWDEGFDNIYQARAFMVAVLQMGAWEMPAFLRGNMAQRHEGISSDHDGVLWREMYSGRIVQWRTMSAGATPTGDDPDASTAQEWRYQTPSSDYGPGGLYIAYVGGWGVQTLSAATASYGTAELNWPCSTNQFPGPKPPWVIPHDPARGVETDVFPSSAPLCFGFPGNPPNLTGHTDFGEWLLVSSTLDPLVGCYWQGPPQPYMGEPASYYTFDPAGEVRPFPGWTQWRERVLEHCFTGEFAALMLPWFRRRYRHLNTGPSYRWQRAALSLPWRGHVEFRIWQRVLYLRGQLTNPFVWGTVFAGLPPGVRAVNRFSYCPGTASLEEAADDGTPTGRHFSSPWRIGLSQNSPSAPLTLLAHNDESYENPGNPGIGRPHTLNVDNVTIAIEKNHDPGPDGNPIVP